MSVNVNRSVSDQFYRYKMPRLIAKVTFPRLVSLLNLSGWFLNLLLCFQVEGKGNGIKTVIVNMVDVAKALNRPPTCQYCLRFPLSCQNGKTRRLLKYRLPFVDPTKFFGCELGAQTQFDTKNDRYIVNGSHEANKLQDMLDGFIKKFVLCAECDNPETDLVSPGLHL